MIKELPKLETRLYNFALATNDDELDLVFTGSLGVRSSYKPVMQSNEKDNSKDRDKVIGFEYAGELILGELSKNPSVDIMATKPPKVHPRINALGFLQENDSYLGNKMVIVRYVFNNPVYMFVGSTYPSDENKTFYHGNLYGGNDIAHGFRVRLNPSRILNNPGSLYFFMDTIDVEKKIRDNAYRKVLKSGEVPSAFRYKEAQPAKKLCARDLDVIPVVLKLDRNF